MQVFKVNKAFRVMIIAQFFNNIGSSFFNIVFLIYAATLPNKTLAVTLVAFAEFFPSLLSVVMGNLADKTKNHLRAWSFARLSQAGIFLIVTVILTLWHGRFDSFIVLLILIFFADTIGSYSNLLMTPVSRYILSDDQLQNAMGLEQAVSITVSLIGGFAGVGLLGLLHQDYAAFSLINAFMFIVAWLIMTVNRHHFKQAEAHIETTQRPKSTQPMWHDLKTTFSYVYQDKLFFQLMLLATAVNFIGTSLNGVFNVTLLHEKTLLIGSFGTTVAMFGAIFSTGMLLGSLLPIPFLSHLTTKQLLAVALTGVLGLELVPIIYPNGSVWMIISFVVAYFNAQVNPKFGAILMKRIDQNKLASVSGLLNTFALSSAPIGQFLFLGIANLISPNISWLIMAIVTLMTVVYIILTRQHDIEKVEKTGETAIL
ncbi:MFS transporter [Leuconostoc falkenbergense]|uniref:MFS transporter n=1 Tax=Leuconostoc falkenbergense TaxID=2766470 RepID=UPI0024A81675|nr:MFS transporter [Leuconostoc falkenbergense]MDI6552961.1 MFS transporter [Leuconostoc falkenbergense]